MTDRDLPPEQPGYPPSEGDPRDTGALRNPEDLDRAPLQENSRRLLAVPGLVRSLSFAASPPFPTAWSRP